MTRAATTEAGDEAAGGSAEDHLDRNDVRLIGRVTSAPERRVLPSGDELVALGISVRRPGDDGVDAVPIQVGPAPPVGHRPRPPQVGRRLLAAAERLNVGDRVEVTGVLRRRWWAAGGARRSRLEVAAERVERTGAREDGVG